MTTSAANADNRSMDAVGVFDLKLATQKEKLRRIAELRQEIQSIWRTTYPGYAGLRSVQIEVAKTPIDVEYEAEDDAVQIISASVDGADITELADLLGLPDLVQDYHDKNTSREEYDLRRFDDQRKSA